MEVATAFRDDASKQSAASTHEAAIQAFVALNSWADTALQTWSCPHLELCAGEGSGQYASPFTITSHDFAELCRKFDFSTRLIRKLRDHSSVFEHVFHYPDPAGTSRLPSHLEIFASVYENDAFSCFFRYDIHNNTAKCVLFVKTGDYSERRLMRASDILIRLEHERELLDRHPLLALDTVFSVIQDRAHEFLDWRIRLNEMESQLGVTKYAEALRQGRYETISHDFEMLNADVAILSKMAANNALSVSTILQHVGALLRLATLCDSYRDYEKKLEPNSFATSESQEQIQGTIKRGELYLEFTKMTQLILQSQTAILYNRISRQDSQSMKTIAVATLFFLPSTFVSTVFASGIFNFQANEPEDAPRTISQYGWIYLIICILITCLTLGFWLVWYTWGRKILEASRLSQTRKGKESVRHRLLARLKSK